jgi:hypothetical protein
VDRNRLDAHLLTGPDDAIGDLASIGDQNFADLSHKNDATVITE